MRSSSTTRRSFSQTGTAGKWRWRRTWPVSGCTVRCEGCGSERSLKGSVKLHTRRTLSIRKAASLGGPGPSKPRVMRRGHPVACLLLVLTARHAAAFSTFAGSCKHAGVNHGLDKFEAQECVPAGLAASQPAADPLPQGLGGAHALPLSTRRECAGRHRDRNTERRGGV